LESPIAQSELPTLSGTDLSEREALDPEAVPSATPSDESDGRESTNSPAVTAVSQPSKTFIAPTSFYAKPPENKEKRKPLWVPCLFS